MAWSFIRATAGATLPNGATSASQNFGAATTLNDRVIVVVNYWAGFATPGVTGMSDAKGNTYHNDLTFTYADGNFNGVIGIWSANLGTALGATDNVTVTLSTGGSGQTEGRWALLEYRGLSTALNPVDVTHSNTSGGTAKTAVTTGTSTATTGASELVLIAFGDDGYVVGWSAAPTGTARVNLMSDTIADTWVADKDSGGSGTTQSASGTLGGAANWGAALVVYKLTGITVGTPINTYTHAIRTSPIRRGRSVVSTAALAPLPPTQVTTGHVRRVRPAMRPSARLIPPPPPPLLPQTPLPEHLRRMFPRLRGAMRLETGAPTPMRPRMTAEHIKHVRPHGTARAQVAGVSLAAAPLAAYTRLLRALPALRGKAQVATPGPLPGFPILPARNPLVRIVTALRGRTTPIERAIPQPQVVHTLLRAPAPRARSVGQVARPGPLPGRPLTSFTRLRFPAPIRRSWAALIGWLTVPYTGTVIVFDYVYDSQGRPVSGKRVEVQLLSSNWVYVDAPTSWVKPIVIVAVTDANGYWQVVTTAGTPTVNYAVSVPGIGSYEIAVPAAPGPFQSSTILAS